MTEQIETTKYTKELNTCKYFNGIQHQKCLIDIEYRKVRDESRSPYTFPCLAYKPCNKHCEKRLFPTLKEVIEEQEEMEKALNKYLQSLADNKCPECGTIITNKSQIGNCVYSDDCGHRLYQGKL